MVKGKPINGDKQMTKYEDMSLEELQELKANKVKQEIIEELKKDEEAKILAEKKALEDTLRAEITEEVKNNYTPTEVPIVQNVELDTGSEKLNDAQQWFSDTYGTTGINLYENIELTNSDSGCDVDVDSWEKTDVFVNAIWHTMYEASNLLKVCVKGLSIGVGDGHTVQIRTITRFSRSDITETSAPCECISCSSTSFSTYSISIKKYGISTEICEWDVWQVGNEYRTNYLKSLGGVWAEQFDYLIYNELDTATPGYTTSVATSVAGMSGSCCSDSFLLAAYNGIDSIVTQMRTAYYKPDYILMHPNMAAVFRRMQDPAPIFANTIDIAKNGALKSILGIPVIEYAGAVDPLDTGTTTGDELVIIIDSSRAVGGVFGKKPRMESERNIDCDSTTYAMWCYFGAAELDTGAIGHVVAS